MRTILKRKRDEDISSGYLLSESKECIPLRSRDKIGGVVLSGGVDSAKATCNADAQCLGFTFNNILESYDWEIKPDLIRVEHSHIDDIYLSNLLREQGYTTYTERFDIYGIR